MKHLLLFALFGTALFAQSGGQPVNIPIQNPSFELESTPPDSGACFSAGWQGEGGFQIPGWQFAAASGVLKLVNPNPCNIAVPAPDGSFVAYAGNSTITQDTGVVAADVQQNGGPTRSGIYEMTLSVADYYPPYPSYVEAKISLGTPVYDANGQWVGDTNVHELCYVDTPMLYTWNSISLTCLSPGYVVYDGWPDGAPFDPKAHLIISLGASWWEGLFDKVSLTFTPTN